LGWKILNVSKNGPRRGLIAWLANSGAAFGVSVVDFLFFFHGYGFCWTGSHARHAENAVIRSHRNGFLSVWMFRKVLKFEDVDRTNIHADTVTVALVPINRNFYHRIYLGFPYSRRKTF
jgi:hypothetical protein